MHDHRHRQITINNNNLEIMDGRANRWSTSCSHTTSDRFFCSKGFEIDNIIISERFTEDSDSIFYMSVSLKRMINCFTIFS